MQQIVNLKISIEKGYEEIRSNIKALIRSYSFETPFSQEETEKRINNWIEDIRFIPSDTGGAGEIISHSEVTMYVFDYDAIFPALYEDLAGHCSDSEFYGHSEYYNDDYGIMTYHDKKYVEGKLSEGIKKTRGKSAPEYRNNVSFKMPEEDSDMRFSYEKIDMIPGSLYEGMVYENLSLPEDGMRKMMIGNLKFDVRIKIHDEAARILSGFKNVFMREDLEYPLFDPCFALSRFGAGLEQMIGWSEFSEALKELSNEQIEHRTKLFLKAVERLSEDETIRTVLSIAPKKKDGTLHAKRVTPIAALFCMDENAQIYQLRAKADSSDVLTIEIIQTVCPQMEKLDLDIISTTDYFRNDGQ